MSPFLPFGIIAILTLPLLGGCAGVSQTCSEIKSPACERAETLWQDSINRVVSVNFPQETGLYRARVWLDDFDNAWVTRGREINITQSFLEKLSREQRICVAAHELGHLKLGHYFSQVGIILYDPGVMGHYGKGGKNIPKGFGVGREEEADMLAAELMEQAGVSASVYLDLLKRFLTEDTDSGRIRQRIAHLQQVLELRKHR